ncbi:MAG: LLM class flavin-dependent oxidoreductase [Solirubrobacterales bacterium]|nr:LLM class flavin-dependent oxidoreductase [Solirubrobacterales bacterium]MBV9714754.1 LLM class flavin-dependent oxidoreductase [Solirubrobacterales bacterium]
MGTGCFISPGRSLPRALERVKLADSLGYEAVFTTHIAGAESLTLLTAYAMASERVRVGSAVVPIYTRTPATMAQTAATIDELSGGRFILGLGVSHRPVVEAWHGQTIDRPVAEMRDYAMIVRAILRGEEPPASEKWRTNFRLAGLEHRPALPIYIAALSPAMLRLAGEVGDGVLLWLCNPNYVRDVVVPEVTTGRERADKTLTGFTVAAAIPAAVTDDVRGAYERLRTDLLTYFGLPFYRAMLERSGFGEDIAAFDAAEGDLERMRAAISEEFLATLTAIGDEHALRQGVERYARAGVTLPCVGAVPMTDFDAMLRSAAR